MVSITRYRLEEQGGIYFRNGIRGEHMPCVRRRAVGAEPAGAKADRWRGEKITLMIRRLFCEKCGRHHHELPDSIVPYKRHSAETIEKIISGGEVGEESRTARRIAAWWCGVGPYFLNIVKSLGEKYKIPHNRAPTFREIVRAVVNSGNWIFAERICTHSVSASRQWA